MILAAHQPNYAPWVGYFAKMRACDVFVFLDDVAMPSRGNYVTRVLIDGPGEPKWLSVPVHYEPGDRIIDVHLADAKWSRKHLGTLRTVYGRSRYFKEVFALLEPLYAEPGTSLAECNMRMVRAIAGYLQLSCRFEKSSDLQPEGQSDDRLISLARLVGADTYVSGKGGQNYEDPAKFSAAGIRLETNIYTPIPYDQGGESFVPGLSVLDALFHLGRDAIQVMKYPVREAAAQGSLR
jgi:hypothetical protein